MAYKRHLFILILLFIQDKEKFLFIQDKERYYTEEEKDSQRVFSLYFGVPHLREYLFNVNIHICEILSSREKDKERYYTEEEKDSQRISSLYFGVPHLREYLFNVNIHIYEILSRRETPSLYCGILLSCNLFKRGFTV